MRLDLIVSVHAAAVLKLLARRNRVTEAVALADALKLAERAALAEMRPAERDACRKAVRVAGVPILG